MLKPDEMLTSSELLHTVEVLYKSRRKYIAWKWINFKFFKCLKEGFEKRKKKLNCSTTLLPNR